APLPQLELRDSDDGVHDAVLVSIEAVAEDVPSAALELPRKQADLARRRREAVVEQAEALRIARGHERGEVSRRIRVSHRGLDVSSAPAAPGVEKERVDAPDEVDPVGGGRLRRHQGPAQPKHPVDEPGVTRDLRLRDVLDERSFPSLDELLRDEPGPGADEVLRDPAL